VTAAALLLIILHIQAGAADQSGSMRFDYAVRSVEVVEVASTVPQN
jgi:hypothetical protein